MGTHVRLQQGEWGMYRGPQVHCRCGGTVLGFAFAGESGDMGFPRFMGGEGVLDAQTGFDEGVDVLKKAEGRMAGHVVELKEFVSN